MIKYVRILAPRGYHGIPFGTVGIDRGLFGNSTFLYKVEIEGKGNLIAVDIQHLVYITKKEYFINRLGYDTRKEKIT